MAKKKTSKKTEKAEQSITITPPRLSVAELEIEGLTPYVQNKFSAKAIEQMRQAQEAGSKNKSRKKREPKDFDEIYKGKMHVSEDGWVGIPAPAFRNAMIDACRLVGFKMTHMKMSIMVLADGYDKDEGTPLVRIYGEPKKHESYVRLQGTTTDITVRPMWRDWSCKVRVQWDEDQFTGEDVANLLSRAGQQVGVGEGRPFSKNSGGQGWGTFKLKETK